MISTVQETGPIEQGQTTPAFDAMTLAVDSLKAIFKTLEPEAAKIRTDPSLTAEDKNLFLQDLMATQQAAIDEQSAALHASSRTVSLSSGEPPAQADRAADLSVEFILDMLWIELEDGPAPPEDVW